MDMLKLMDWSRNIFFMLILSCIYLVQARTLIYFNSCTWFCNWENGKAFSEIDEREMIFSANLLKAKYTVQDGVSWSLLLVSYYHKTDVIYNKRILRKMWSWRNCGVIHIKVIYTLKWGDIYIRGGLNNIKYVFMSVQGSLINAWQENYQYFQKLLT